MCGERNCSNVDRVTGGLEPRASILTDRRSVTPLQLKCVIFHVISRDVVTFIHCPTVVATVNIIHQIQHVINIYLLYYKGGVDI